MGENVDRMLSNLFAAIELCLDRDLTLPSLVLIYSGIDAMAFLFRAPENADVTRSDFISWAERFMLPLQHSDCSAIDLYAARCSVLHSHAAESSLSRRGDAREVYYTTGELRITRWNVDPSRGPWWGSAVLNVSDLLSSFRVAIERARADAAGRAELQELISARARVLFSTAPM